MCSSLVASFAPCAAWLSRGLRPCLVTLPEGLVFLGWNCNLIGWSSDEAMDDERELCGTSSQP